jgi:branched-chain amino acid transport system permease protein
MESVVHNIGSLLNVDFLQTLAVSQMKMMVFGLALVLVMLFRPEGLFPSRSRRAELNPRAQEPLAGQQQDTLYDTRAAQQE